MEENKKIAEHDQPAVRFIFRSVVELSIHEETERLRVKKSRRRYVIERKMKKKILVYVPGTYISPFVELQLTRNPAIDVAADCLAAPRRSFEANSAAPWQRAPPLDHVHVAAVRAA